MIDEEHLIESIGKLPEDILKFLSTLESGKPEMEWHEIESLGWRMKHLGEMIQGVGNQLKADETQSPLSAKESE